MAEREEDATLISELRELAGNFGQVPSELLMSKAPGSAIKLYAYLDWRAGQKRNAWPGYERIQQDTGMAPATVAAAIEYLKSQGWLTVRRSKRNMYTLPIRSLQLLKYASATSSETEVSETEVSDSEVEPEKGRENQIQESQPRSARAARTCPSAKSNTTHPYYQRCVDAYFNGYRDYTDGQDPKFTPGDGKVLKDTLKLHSADPHWGPKVLAVVKKGASGTFKPLGGRIPDLKAIVGTYFNSILSELARGEDDDR